MDCEVAREALSARIDGERELVPSARVDEHLTECRECCAWHASAVEMARLLKVRPSMHTPDLTKDILQQAGIQAQQQRAHRVRDWISGGMHLRAVLVTIGLAQTALGLAQVFGVHFGMLAGHAHSTDGMTAAPDTSAHLFNESTAWNIAIGIALVVAGVRTRTVSGLVPILSVFVMVLTGFVISDAISGQVTVSRIASHLLVVAGLAAVVAANRHFRQQGTPPPGRTVNSVPTPLSEPADLPTGAKFGRSRGHLRSADDPAA